MTRARRIAGMRFGGVGQSVEADNHGPAADPLAQFIIYCL